MTRIGRTTVRERPGELVFAAPFLSRPRAAALAVGMMLVLALLIVLTAQQAIGVVALFAIGIVCGYFALVLVLDRTVLVVRRNQVVVRRGPIPVAPPTRVDVSDILEVRTTVAVGVAGWGGRAELDTVFACLSNGRRVTLIDDAGSADDAGELARTIAQRLAVACVRD